jgi:heme exporter protein A
MQLTVTHLAFERNNLFLFTQLDFGINAGELLQVYGANGSGKSTLLRILAGFIEPTLGTIQWKNQSVFQQDDYQQQLHYIGHQNGVKYNLTVAENLLLMAALMNQILTTHCITTILTKVGLAPLMHAVTRSLSAGQLRRLSLAKLLLSSRTLWILDEPTTALDQTGQILLIQLLEEHLAAGGIAIVATHQQLALNKVTMKLQLETERA